MLKNLGLSIGGGPQRFKAPLDSILPSAVFDVDATLSDSYPGSGQVWFNLVTTPSGGSPRAAFDYTMGTSNSVAADDPTFVGVPDDIGAYWSLDGGDGFRGIASLYEYTGRLSTTTTGPDFTVVSALRFQSSALDQRIFATQSNAAFSRGISVGVGSDNKLYLSQYGDSAAVQVALNTTLTPGVDYLCIVACEKATNKVRFWLNNRTGTELSFTMNATSYDSLTHAAIGARSAGTAEFLASGTRLYHVALLNGAIGNSDAAKIFNHLNARHGRVYG